MKKKNNAQQNNKQHQHDESPPRRKEVEDIPVQKLPNADRHVDDIIRKYNDFAIVDQD
jgi:hypothetical protein